jgi:hypothetical protein
MPPILLALVAGCITVPRTGRPGEETHHDTPAEKDQRDAARAAFLRLQRTWIDGDAMGALRMMSVQGMSDWFLERTRDKDDPDWSNRVAALDSARKLDLQVWIRENKRVAVPYTDRRAVILPESLLTSQWLLDTWNHYFNLEKDNLRQVGGSMEVAEAYPDGTEVSILVKQNKSPALMYSMVLESGDWKYAYVVRPAGRVKSQ